MIIAFDTETALIRPGLRAPPLTCVTACDDEAELHGHHTSEWPAQLFDRHDGLKYFRQWIQDPEIILVGQNVAFDMCVMMAEDLSLVPLVFKAYDEDRVRDTKLRQQLLDIAAGCYRGRFADGSCQKWIKYGYSLDDLSRRLLRWTLDKDTWRLRYGELRDVPLDQWDPGAREYPKHDARATLGVYLSQEGQDRDGQFLIDQHRQSRRFLSYSLMEAWGLRTRPEGVGKFAEQIDTKLAEVQKELIALGLVRPNGVRDTKAASRLMVQVCNELCIPVVPTEGGEKRLISGETLVDDGISLDLDSCKRTEDHRLELYAEYGVLKAVQSKDLPMLKAGIMWPIHTRIDMAENGRTTSSKPNVQNLRRLEGIREAFVPREGWVYAQADYPSLELHTLAQCCIDLFGHSKLADMLNSGVDALLELASRIEGISYREAKIRLDAKDPVIKNTRQMSKVFMYGSPGGLGPASMVSFGRASYGVVLTEEECKSLKLVWLEMLPEMKEYFRLVSNQCAGELGGEIIQLRSLRRRGGCRYTAACNTYFSGLGADATGEAGWEISKACYVDKSSPLYGSRKVNFVHDEFIAETRDNDNASPAVWELCRIMKDSANRWLPDVPFTEIEPVLMRFWSKNARSIIDNEKKVHIWVGEDAA